MATSRIDGDLNVSGNVTVGGSVLPGITRANMIQEDFAAYPVRFTDLRVWDAYQTAIGTAGSDDLGLSTGGTWGINAPYISAGDLKAAGATTRRARFLYTLPPEYVAGQSIRISAFSGMITTAADTSCTIDFEAYAVVTSGTGGTITGSDLVTTSATSINSTTLAEKAFDLTATGRVAGDVIDIRMSIACTDAATVTAVIPAVAALQMKLDIKG